METAPMTAAMKNNIAATCSTRAKLASVSVLAAISPTHAVAIRAERRPTTFCIAEAIRPCSGSTDDKFSAVNGVLVSTAPVPNTIIPGSRSVTTWNPCAAGRMSR
jgi:hypothetical protein